MSNDNAQNAPGHLPICYMAAGVAKRLKAKSPERAPNYGATTTVTIAAAFKDDAPLYDQASLDAAVAAERERCASVVRYWLTGHAPATGTHEARCLAHVLDGSPAPTGWTERPQRP